MIKNSFYFFCVLIILGVGLFQRINYHSRNGYNSDEMYQLMNVQKLKNFNVIFKNSQFYGDHTTFPGEFILHYQFLKWSGLFSNPAKIELDKSKAENVTMEQLDKLIFPKMILTILAVLVFFLLCTEHIKTWLGVIVATIIFSFHPHLIMHSLEFRPYGALIALGIFNFFLVNKDGKLCKILYYSIFFITCIYHAYGILIAGLPLVYNLYKKNGWLKIPKGFILVIILSLMAWGYYAAANNFGISPNNEQNKVNSFEYIPVANIFEKVLSQPFGNMALYTIFIPLIFLSMIKSQEGLSFFILLIALPITLIILVDLKTNYWILGRQWCWVIPFFCLFVGKQLDKLAGKENGI